MKKGMRFETALKELEKIVESLESQELPLDKALSTFEQGVKLSRYCARLLDEAEAKIKVLTQEQDGSARLEEWQDEDSPGSSKAGSVKE